jgi:hypothetical protein
MSVEDIVSDPAGTISSVTAAPLLEIQAPTMTDARVHQSTESYPSDRIGIQSPGLVLDFKKVARIVADGRETRRLLGEALTEDEPHAGTSGPEPKSSGSDIDPRFDGLKCHYHALLARLLTREVWHRGDFDRLVRSFRLMPSGACEDINEWSEVRFSDQLIQERDEDFVIQSRILEGQL